MKRLPSIALAACALAVSGCHLFSKSSSQPKPNPSVATDVENDFMKRSVDKRVNELCLQGMSKSAAYTQAMEEFREKYPYTHVAQEPASPQP